MVDYVQWWCIFHEYYLHCEQWGGANPLRSPDKKMNITETVNKEGDNFDISNRYMIYLFHINNYFLGIYTNPSWCTARTFWWIYPWVLPSLGDMTRSTHHYRAGFSFITSSFLVDCLAPFFPPYLGNSNPNCLIFFRGVESTNQFFCSLPFVCSSSHVVFGPAAGRVPFQSALRPHTSTPWVVLYMIFWFVQAVESSLYKWRLECDKQRLSSIDLDSGCLFAMFDQPKDQLNGIDGIECTLW